MKRKRLIILFCLVFAFLTNSFPLAMAKGGITAIPQVILGSGFTYQCRIGGYRRSGSDGLATAPGQADENKTDQHHPSLRLAGSVRKSF